MLTYATLLPLCAWTACSRKDLVPGSLHGICNDPRVNSHLSDKVQGYHAILAGLLALELLITPVFSRLFFGWGLVPFSYKLVAASLQVTRCQRSKDEPKIPFPLEELLDDNWPANSVDAPKWATLVELVFVPIVHAMLGLLLLFDQTSCISCFASLPLLSTVCSRVIMEKEKAWEEQEREGHVYSPLDRLVHLYSHNSDLLKLGVLLSLAAAHILSKCMLLDGFDLEINPSRKTGQHTLTYFLGAFVLPELFQFFGWSLFAYVYCPSSRRKERCRWVKFDRREKHDRDGQGDEAWKMVKEENGTIAHNSKYVDGDLTKYDDLARQLAQRLDASATFEICHYYATHGSDDATAHFASIIEIKDAATKSPLLLLRLEYNVIKLVLGREQTKTDPRSVTILTIHRERGCTHTGNDNDGRIEAFPNVVYYSGPKGDVKDYNLPCNHLFNGTPVCMGRPGTERLIRECLRGASILDLGYSHTPDISKGEINCLVYAVQFAAPVMAANAMGSAFTYVWLLLAGYKGSAIFRVRSLLERHGWPRAARLIPVVWLILGYLACAFIYIFGASTMEATAIALNSASDVAINSAEQMAGIDFDGDGDIGLPDEKRIREFGLWLTLSALSLFCIIYAALSDVVSPVQVGILKTIFRAASLDRRRSNTFIRMAIMSQVSLMFVNPLGPTLSQLYSDVLTMMQYLLRESYKESLEDTHLTDEEKKWLTKNWPTFTSDGKGPPTKRTWTTIKEGHIDYDLLQLAKDAARVANPRKLLSKGASLNGALVRRFFGLLFCISIGRDSIGRDPWPLMPAQSDGQRERNPLDRVTLTRIRATWCCFVLPSGILMRNLYQAKLRPFAIWKQLLKLSAPILRSLVYFPIELNQYLGSLHPFAPIAFALGIGVVVQIVCFWEDSRPGEKRVPT